MAIRSSSGVSSSSVQSFLRGAAAQQAALIASQQDEAWQEGQTTDADYLAQLQVRKSQAPTELQQQTISNTITNLNQTMQRKSIQNAIDSGSQVNGHPATYVDLVTFEQGLLNGMQPGSTAYDDQQSRVDSATQQVVTLARDTLNQQIQNRQATPNDLASFEKSTLNAFQVGTPEYQAQLYNVEDSQRKADQYNYSATTSVEDAQTAMKIQAAKNAGNVPLVMQLSQAYAQTLSDRYTQNPQYFTDINGNPTASYYSLQTKINSTVQDASNFATTTAATAAAAGKKAFSDSMATQQKNYANITAQADNQIDQIQKGKGKNADGSPMDAQQSAAALQALYQNKVNAGTAYINGLNQALQIAPDAASALQVQTDITTQATQVTNFSTQRDNMAKLISGGQGIVNVYDPSTGTSMPTAVNQFGANGKVDPTALIGNDPRGGAVQGANGQNYYIKGGDQVLSYKNQDGTTDQYFVDASGTVMYRQLPAFPTSTGKDINSQQTAYQQEAANTTYTPLGNSQDSVAQNLVAAEQAHPGISQSLGLPASVQQQVTQAAGPALNVDSAPTSAGNDATENPVQQDLKVQNKPDSNSIGTTLKVVDANQQTQIAQQTASSANDQVNVLKSTNDALSGHIQDLTVQQQSAAQLAASLQAQVAAGNTSLAAQLKAAQSNATNTKQLQSTASGSNVQPANINPQGTASTGTAVSPQNAGQGTPAVPNANGTGGVGSVPGVVQAK